ncbi:MAG: hypothetical protein ACI9SC_001926 [Gammaproteobacteria bacterium]|jgi:hypothetical protein
MTLNRMQDQLQKIYDLPTSHHIQDFLITSNSELSQVEGELKSRHSDEKLLVHQSDNELLVSLFIAEDLLQKLESDNPYKNLNQNNIADFCTVLEGVSHFLYLTWNAGHDRSVSQLELELQAEVDKFVSIYNLFRMQGNLVEPAVLMQWLFENCSFAANLDADELDRYQMANQLAHRFCQHIEAFMGSTRNQGKAYRQLRRFYRRRHLHKLEGIRNDEYLVGP